MDRSSLLFACPTSSTKTTPCQCSRVIPEHPTRGERGQQYSCEHCRSRGRRWFRPLCLQIGLHNYLSPYAAGEIAVLSCFTSHQASKAFARSSFVFPSLRNRLTLKATSSGPIASLNT